MIIRGVVDRIEGDYVVILLGDEGYVVKWPRQLLPRVQESDLLGFEINLELPASEVKKMTPKSLLERLSLRS
ncbi:MAG: Uncharacterized protein XD63_1279 [Thermoanaerobacterales bacterium 50_218]|nr:MAG: Uncharacterized protein XD63_1279 [Thermoanaerobacterales bacterium 50_218]HAA90504.1 hypothetical protein [Peptococcaceae bacterium]